MLDFSFKMVDVSFKMMDFNFKMVDVGFKVDIHAKLNSAAYVGPCGPWTLQGSIPKRRPGASGAFRPFQKVVGGNLLRERLWNPYRGSTLNGTLNPKNFYFGWLGRVNLAERARFERGACQKN